MTIQVGSESVHGARELPRYVCHKEVHALKIKAVDMKPVFGGGLSNIWLITPEEEGYGPIAVDHEWIRKHNPQFGGYYVVYADGYTSYSPQKAFEEGYARA